MKSTPKPLDKPALYVNWEFDEDKEGKAGTLQLEAYPKDRVKSAVELLKIKIRENDQIIINILTGKIDNKLYEKIIMQLGMNQANCYEVFYDVMKK